MAKAKDDAHLEELAASMKAVVIKTFKDRSTRGIDEKVDLKKIRIVDFEGEYRISGMDKFNESTYITTFSCYRSAEDQKKRKGCGAFVFYYLKEQAPFMLKSLNFRGFNDEDDESMMETCGEFSKQLVGNFDKEISAGLIFSEPDNYYNEVPFGIDFGKDQYDQYELMFFTKEKRESLMALDMTLSPLK